MSRRFSTILMQQVAAPTLRLAAALLALSPCSSSGAAGDPDAPLRFGFTRSMFVDLNEGDTRAAVKSYALLLASNNDLSVSDSPGVLENSTAVADAFAKGGADIVSLTTIEYLDLPHGSTYSRIIAAAMGGTNSESYILLVRSDSPFEKIDDLRGRKLLIYSSLRGCLSPLWLDVLLATQSLEEPQKFFGSITTVKKPSRTVLPVFFGKADACIVTQGGFKVLSEMNPQVMKQMKILASSPELIPTVTCVRGNIPTKSFERIFKAVVNAQHTVSGRQVLTIFQCDNITEISDEEVAPVRELLATQKRLRAHPAALASETATTSKLQ